MDVPSEYQQGRVYTLETPNLIVEGVPVNTFHYKPDQSYSFETWEAINDWLKTNSLEIDGIPVNGFERDSQGRLTAMPLVPFGKAIAVAEIVSQLANWNIFSGRRGAVTSSQGGFLIGPGTIKAPDVAFTPSRICSGLTAAQQFSFRGVPFCPTFVVELDDLTIPQKLGDLTKKIKESYFPSGVQLAWLLDPVHEIFYEFEQTRTGVIRCSPRQWYKDNQPACITGGNVLPGFKLKLSQIKEVYTVFQQNAPAAPAVPAAPTRFTCSQCNQSFAGLGLLDHLEEH